MGNEYRAKKLLESTGTASEKDIKSSLPSGASSVRSLTSRFDYKDGKDNKESEEAEVELKRVVNNQFKQISNLRTQVECKERKIMELESTIKVLTRNNTPVGTPG